MSTSCKRLTGWPAMIRRIVFGIAAIAIVVVGVFRFSPLPGVLLIRAVFRKNDRDVMTALQKHAPANVTSFEDVHYRRDDKHARLDVHVPNAAIVNGERLPTVVWPHGGAWVAGSKDEWAPYFKVLASRGYTVVGVNYSLGPEQTYPTALIQLNDAIGFLQASADQFHIDPETIVLAGDSAGAQISSQMAAVVTNPRHANSIGIRSSITPDQLKGTILYCGIFDLANYFGADGPIGWGSRIATWAYTGNRGTTFHDNPALAEMSTINHVTPDFPPTFISGGNTDPLTAIQSRPLTEKLQRLGVDVTTLFFPDDHSPGLSHEYQFNLDNADGQKALSMSVTFLRQVCQERTLV